MLRRFRIATLLAVMAVAACKTSDKPAAPKPAPTGAAAPAAKPAAPTARADPPARPADPALAAVVDSQLQTRSIAMMRRMADLFAADGKDCEKLAADLKTFIADNKSLLSQLDALTEEQKEAFPANVDVAAVQATIAEKMQGAMIACAENPSLRAAMQEFPAE
jgi:hypothetical protein